RSRPRTCACARSCSQLAAARRPRVHARPPSSASPRRSSAYWAGPLARVTVAERDAPERSVSRIVIFVPGFFARIAAPIELGEEVVRPLIAVITSPAESPAAAAGLPRRTSAITAPGDVKSLLRNVDATWTPRNDVAPTWIRADACPAWICRTIESALPIGIA